MNRGLFERHPLLAVLGRILLAPLVGVALAFLLLVYGLLPVMGLGSVARIVALGHHLDQPLAPRPMVVFLGNSITREGIDARTVESAAPAGWHAQNLALSGCAPTELRVLLPKLLAAAPTAVVLAFHPQDLGRADDLDLDKAYAYAFGGFAADWPSHVDAAEIPGLSKETFAALRSSRLDQELHFRTVPLNAFNAFVRLRVRRDRVRATAADNWVDPYEMTSSIRDQRLDWHLDTVRADMTAALKGGVGTGAENVARLVAATRASGATPILVSLPLHPQLRETFSTASDRLRTVLQELADRYDGTYLDAVDVLSADDYADAVHPNAAGRQRYSEFIGQRLPTAPEDGQQPSANSRRKPPAQDPPN